MQERSFVRRLGAVLLSLGLIGTTTAAEVHDFVYLGADRSDDRTDRLLAKTLEQIETLVASSNSGPGIAIGITDRERLRGLVVHGYSDLKAKTPVAMSARTSDSC